MGDVFWQGIAEHFKDEWAVVTGAPVLFLLAAMAVGAVVYLVVRGHFSERLQLQDARIAFLGEQLAEYKDKLSGATPEQAAAEIGHLRSDLTAARAQLDMITQWYLHHRLQRTLTVDQKAKLIAAMTEVAVKIPDAPHKVSFAAVADPEAQQYGIEILRTLHSAGFCIAQETPVFTWSDTPDERGVMLVVRDEKNPPELAKAIKDAFAVAGVECTYDTSSTHILEDQCMIGIGQKPDIAVRGEAL